MHLSSDRPRVIAAIGVMAVGFSLANAAGGVLQALFYLVCVSSFFIYARPLPKLDLLVLGVCVTYLISLKTVLGFSIDSSSVKILRPFIEGYLIAGLLFGYCRIRNIRSFAVSLSGYVVLQFLVAVVMLSNLGLRELILGYIYRDESYGYKTFASALAFRGFGISAHHLFGFPLAVGVASTVMIAMSLEKPRRRSLFFFLVAFLGGVLTLINARIGMLSLTIAYGLGVTLFFRRRLLFQLLATVFIFVPSLMYIASLYLGAYYDFVVSWLVEGVSQFNVFNSQRAGGGTLDDLSGMLFLPSGLHPVLFGFGSLCAPGEYCYSDVGWVRLIFEGGLVYLALVSLLYYRIHGNILKFAIYSGYPKVLAWYLVVVLFVTFVAAMFKGDAFAANDYSRMIVAMGYLGMFTSLSCRRKIITNSLLTERSGDSK